MTNKKVPPWLAWAKKFKNKNENDPAFNKEMSKYWSLFGMKLGTIAQSWAAWCGLAMARSLHAVGLKYDKEGALAREWADFGIPINWKVDGIPRGAILHLNHNFDPNSSKGNHVTTADGDYTAEYLKKPGARVNGYGGNQGNTWKTSSYSVKEIMAVRWPADYPAPGKVLVTDTAPSNSAGEESTR